MKEIQLVLGYLLLNYRIMYDGEEVDILKHRQTYIANIFISPKIGVRVEKL